MRERGGSGAGGWFGEGVGGELTHPPMHELSGGLGRWWLYGGLVTTYLIPF